MNEPTLETNVAVRRRVRWIGLVVLALVGAGGCLWFGMSPRVLAVPAHLERGDDGKWPADPNRQGGPWLEVQAAVSTSNNSSNAFAVSSKSSHAGFACARLILVNRSKHLLLARAGEVLVERLKELGFVRQIEYYPFGFNPTPGGPAPDLLLTLDAREVKGSTGPWWEEVDAQVVLTASNDLPGCGHGYSDNLTPPVVRLDWCCELHHRSTSRGVASSAARYKQAADNVGKQLASALGKELAERLKKEGPLPALPAAFYPAYRPAPALPMSDLGRLELVWSWHGMMSRNESLWQWTSDRPVRELVDELAGRLKEAGWKTGDVDRKDRPYLRATRDNTVLVAYLPAERAQGASPAPGLFAHYTDRMTAAEVESAIDQALADGAPTDVLLCLENAWTKAQSQKLVERLKKAPPRTPQAALTLARLYNRTGDKDLARAELPRVQALLRTVSDYNDLQNQAKKLAKNLGDEKALDKPIDVTRLAGFGFTELKHGQTVPPREVALDEPAHYYFVDPKGKLHTVSVRVIRPGGGNTGACDLASVESTEHGRSWGSGGAVRHCSLEDGHSVNFQFAPAAAGRFQIIARENP